MPLNEEQFERVGRWLDGQDVSLSRRELAVARRIRADEAMLADKLDVPGAAQAVVRVKRRLRVLALRRRRRIWSLAGSGLAAAAAAVLIASVLWFGWHRTGPAGRPGGDLLGVECPVDLPYEPPERLEVELALLDEELTSLQEALDPHALDQADPENLELELEAYWLSDPVIDELDDTPY